MEALSKLFIVTVIAEWIAFFASILLLNRRTKVWRLFILFLLITLLAETGGWYMRVILKSENYRWVFNVLLIISIPFYIYIFLFAEPFQKNKRKLTIGLFVFLFFAVLNLIFFQGYLTYNNYTEVCGDIIIALLCGYFLYIMTLEDRSRNLFQYEYFWFAAGLLLFALGSFILFLFSNLILKYYKETHIDIGGKINDILNVILYGSFIIAFIWRRKNTKQLLE